MKEFITPPEHIHLLAKKLFTDCGEIIDGSIAYLEKGGGGPTSLHTYEHNHLFIVFSGQARIELDGEVKIVNANESFLVNGKVPHSVWNNIEGTTVMIGISVKAK